eukprot:TRINITY_DN558_c6_g1_i1.p1 TRINITY_DN558_c6_g1~~TRINITY_DN558_c6_g1_i1.p1  ORF type:complete len:379 (+),score=75.39 TRINITY_DN558_c6_g1_i1:49-1137(+)
MVMLQLAFAAAVSGMVVTDSCGEVSVVNATTEICKGSGVLVDMETITSCSQFLCDNFEFEFAMGSDNTSVLTGNSSGCQIIQFTDQNVSEICVAATPIPTPMPTPAPTPVPADCNATQLNNETCEMGQLPLPLDTLTECLSDFCQMFDFEYAIGSDNNSLIEKSTCQIVPFDNQPNISALCVDAPPTTPIPLTPIPETQAPEDVCRPIEVGSGEHKTCSGGTFIVSSEIMDECKEYLCDNLVFDYARGSDNTTVLTNKAEGCTIIPKTDAQSISELCAAAPTPPPSGGGGGSSGMSGAGIFFLVVFLLIVAYLFFGILFNHFVQGKQGLEKIPNYESWCKLKDRCLCRRKGFHAVNADGLAH